jgi:hypothetical protein
VVTGVTRMIWLTHDIHDIDTGVEVGAAGGRELT